MTYLRHAPRHVHHTVANYIETHLDALGWTVPDNVPFDSPIVTVRTSSAINGSVLAAGIGAGTVAITLGNEPIPQDEELGGPLASQVYPIFIDVFQDTEATTLALATDVKDIVMGRLPNTARFLSVVDQSTGVAVPGWTIELEDVERVAPENNFTLYWQVVKVSALAFFQEVQY